MPRLLLVCLGVLLGSAVNAQTPRVNLGTLTCTLAERAQVQKGPGGEERAMRCAFKLTQEAAEQTYSGSIRQVGQGKGPAGKQVMIWIVQGPPQTQLEPGLLEQTYVGGRQRPAGAHPTTLTLVGERNSSIQMRAVTPSGAPSAIAVTVMELKMIAVPA